MDRCEAREARASIGAAGRSTSIRRDDISLIINRTIVEGIVAEDVLLEKESDHSHDCVSNFVIGPLWLLDLDPA